MADLRDLLYGLCNKFPEGLTQTRIRSELTGNGVDSKQITLALNALIDSGDLKVLQRKQADGTTEVLFKAVQREDREKFRGLSSEDMLVYQQIKASKDHGIWVCPSSHPHFVVCLSVCVLRSHHAMLLCVDGSSVSRAEV